jgi:hypothetical protein
MSEFEDFGKKMMVLAGDKKSNCLSMLVLVLDF